MRKDDEIRGVRGALKVYKMIYRIDKLSIILQFPIAFIANLQPYLALFVTGYILNGFVTGETLNNLLHIALIFVGVRFGLNVLLRYMEKVQQAHNDIAIKKIYLEKSKKYMEVDFELLDSPAINEIRERISRDNQWGAGFTNTLPYLRWFLGGTFGFLIGGVMMIPLFISSGVGGVSIFMAGMFAVAGISSWVKSKFFGQGLLKLMQPGKHQDKYRTEFSNFFLWRGNLQSLYKTARIYNTSPYVKALINSETPKRVAFAKKYTWYQGGEAFLSSLTTGLFLVGAYLFVAARAVAGVIPVGDIVFFAGTIKNMADNFFVMTSGFTFMVEQCDRVQSTMEFMELENKQYKGSLPVEKRRDGEYEIEFKNVSFKYSGSKNYALRHFNLKLHIGQKLAIVGMNGSGKTTMIKLLTRLYDPTEGEITLNGIDIKKYDYKEYMGIFSVVFQDFKIFSFTLSDNLALGRAFDKDTANLALDRVGLGERIAKMSNGFSTYMYNHYDEGIEISGGEGQKLALARALYKNAPIFVLDEPTAALDPIAEFEVYSMFNEVIQAKKENTAIFISHRLSSCRFCDDIAVFHEGQLIQRGNHDMLLSDTQGKYHELWNAQAQYYNEK